MITIKYSGGSIESIKDDIFKLAAQGIKEDIMADIEPFSKEIEQCNGSVTINVAKDLSNVNFEFKDIPSELENRILDALGNT